jgi:hypothetical protein
LGIEGGKSLQSVYFARESAIDEVKVTHKKAIQIEKSEIHVTK